jgi:hypothetical protein
MRNKASVTGLGLLAALLLAASASAQQSPTLYRWVDKDGRVHYGDAPAADAKARAVDPRVFSNGQDGGAPSDDDKAAAAKQADCKSRAEVYNRFKSASSFTETDALGNSRTYTPAEKDQLVEHKRQDLVSNCGAAAAADTPAQPAAPQQGAQPAPQQP